MLGQEPYERPERHAHLSLDDPAKLAPQDFHMQEMIKALPHWASLLMSICQAEYRIDLEHPKDMKHQVLCANARPNLLAGQVVGRQICIVGIFG
jgi:hypothetical protein